MHLYLFNDKNIASVFGIGTYIKELVSALESSDIHIHIVHLHAVRPKFEIEKTNQIENWYIPEVINDEISFNSIQNIEDYYRNVLYLLRLYIPENMKNLIFHFNYNQYQWLAKELKTVFDCKTVTTIHFIKWMLELQGNLSLFRALRTKPENQRNSFEQMLITTDEYEILLYKEVDRVIALSQHMQHILVTKYQLDPDKTFVMPNGLEDKSPLIETNREALRRKWKVPEKEFIILFVGRLHVVKGLVFLIDAFRKLLEKVPECRLFIAGNGKYDTYLQESKDICTKITFTGLLEKKELYELYQIADIGVMPSFHEQCSYVAIEMMMHGLPIIGSTSTGLKEMIEDGETGLHIPVIEYEDRVEIDSSLLSEKMLYLLQHPAERERMGMNARKRYLKYYSLDIFRKNMLKFYQSF